MLIASRSDLLIGDMVSVLSLSLPYADPSQGFRVCYGQLGGSAFMRGSAVALTGSGTSRRDRLIADGWTLRILSLSAESRFTN